MSEHGEKYPQGFRIDPIVVVSALLLTLFVLVFGVNMIRAVFFDGGGSSAENQLLTTDRILPTAQPTHTPLAAALLPITPTATATDPPLDIPTSEPTATALPLPTIPPTSPPPTPTVEPTPLAASDEEALFTNDDLIVPPSPTPAPTPTPTPPLPTPSPEGDFEARVPILMYHYISSPPLDADKYRTDLSVIPSQLLAQLEYLRDNGYTTITLNDLARALANLQELPPKPIILTFDDGHLDNYLNAFPILDAMGMVGTFFVITDLPDIEHPDYMSWSMIEEMAAAGMQFEIHTKSHRSLVERDEAFLEEEIAGSQEIIAFHTGTLPRFLSYPGGTYDDATIAAARDLDLWGALTTKHGYTHSYLDRYEMRRVRIRNSTTISFFAEWIEGDELE